MSYNILYFLMENSISLLIGILSANLVGSVGYVIWLFLQKGAAKFYVEKGISFLKILLMSFILPILLAMPLWCIFQVWRTDWDIIGLTIPIKIGIFLLVLIWLIATTIILIYRYASYWRVRYLSFMNVPMEDEEILNMVDKWKTKLNIKKKVTIFYNETIASPTLVYYSGYKILLPVYEMSKSEMNIALLHELTHLKNRDIFTKNIGFVVNALHSFNPITYAIRQEIGKWEEVKCDFCCCETGKDEFTSKEYFRCVMNLKERCGDVTQPDIMCCMFEVKDLLKFRIDVAQQMREERKHSNRSLVIVAILMFTLSLLSFPAVAYGVNYCYEKTSIYVVEDKQKEENNGFREIAKEEFLADAKVSYFEGDILNNSEGTKIQLEAGEVKVFNLPEGYSGELLVLVISNGNPYQFVFESKKKIRCLDRASDDCIRIDVNGQEESYLLIKNTGKEDYQMELLISEMKE